mgnify:CR=1 FL=1
MLRSDQVFGISTDILEPSYVNRGNLDAVVQRDLKRDKHIALRGESKCGKSWLRQRNIPDALVVQCRLNKTVHDLYRDIFSQLGISVSTERNEGGRISTTVDAQTEAGLGVLARLKASLGIAGEIHSSESSLVIGQDESDLRFISDIIKASGRRLVIEDYHYLKPSERQSFAYDLKAFWDYGVYVIIIGIWSENNLLLHLNNDLSNRVIEHSIYWSPENLKLVLDNGSEALNIEFDRDVKRRLVEDAFGAVGTLQSLTIDVLDAAQIEQTEKEKKVVGDREMYEAVAMEHADQLNAIYQTFATRVAKGIRQRKKSTGIYAHMLWAVMEANEKDLIDGLSTDDIFKIASSREGRIQKPNLRQILRKIGELQVDSDGRGLILSYDDTKDEVTVVDKQLFLYRKYATVQWPWEKILEDVNSEEAFSGEG